MQAKRTGSSLWALLLLVALSATSVGTLFGSTHALALERTALEQPLFASLQAADLMAVGTTSISLAPRSRSEGVHQEVTTIVNLSGRTLPVSVVMEGIADLTASVEPGILAPGETGVVRLDGPVPTGSGTFTGTLHLYGFNQYVHFLVPVNVAVPGCGRKPESVEVTAPDTGDRPDGTSTAGSSLEAVSAGCGHSTAAGSVAPPPPSDAATLSEAEALLPAESSTGVAPTPAPVEGAAISPIVTTPPAPTVPDSLAPATAPASTTEDGRGSGASEGAQGT